MAKNKITEADITDLKFDDKNFNKGSEFGNGLIEKSFSSFKAGRGALIDKNNNIIAGNKSIEKFGELGGKKVIIVETTGDEIVVTKRTDIDLNTKEGREMALADNATAKANIVLAHEVICEEVGTEIAETWGVVNEDYSHKNKEVELDENEKFSITLNFTSEDFFKVKEAIGKKGITAEQILFKALNIE